MLQSKEREELKNLEYTLDVYFDTPNGVCSSQATGLLSSLSQITFVQIFNNT